MICPVCYNRIKYNGNTCGFCGFEKGQLKTASNKAIKQAKKQGNYDDIVYIKQFPKDLDRKKTIKLAILLGWLGIHNFYVGKVIKGSFMLISLLSSVVLTIMLASNLLPQSYMNIVSLSGVFIAVSLIMWLWDIMGLLFNNFKVPVVLQKDIKRKNK